MSRVWWKDVLFSKASTEMERQVGTEKMFAAFLIFTYIYIQQTVDTSAEQQRSDELHVLHELTLIQLF